MPWNKNCYEKSGFVNRDQKRKFMLTGNLGKFTNFPNENKISENMSFP